MKKKIVFKDSFDESDCFGDSYQMWVVGNIHDNADLIK